MIRPLLVAMLLVATPALGAEPAREGDFVIRDFKFRSGESLPQLKIHYLALGKAARDAGGHATNAVLVLHGTGGTGRQFLAPQFAGVLYGPGAPLDTTKLWVILPDGIGHGGSSKPSDGLRARFPHYDYDDMVAAHHQLLTEGLGIQHLRLAMGTSMGGMQSWVWGERYPDFMDALMPLASLPVAIVGRNRVWREMVMDAIRGDPEWKGGDYTVEPRAALREAQDLLIIAGSAPLYMQGNLPTRDSADVWLERTRGSRMAALDANDLLYQLDASRNYDPSPRLGTIKAPLVAINSADDFINPPELGIMEREIRKVPGGRFVLIPISERTRGHGSHTWAVLWKDELVALLRASGTAATKTANGGRP
jgi:homoserine O-acetyltransferase